MTPADRQRIKDAGPFQSSREVQQSEPPRYGRIAFRVWIPWTRLSDRDALEATVARVLNEIHGDDA